MSSKEKMIGTMPSSLTSEEREAYELGWEKCEEYLSGKTTDGSAVRALEFISSLSSESGIQSPQIKLKLAITEANKALQSTRKPPVDTISIKREVLQGVRAALKCVKRDWHYDELNRINSVAIENALASLDAVLEGE